MTRKAEHRDHERVRLAYVVLHEALNISDTKAANLFDEAGKGRVRFSRNKLHAWANQLPKDKTGRPETFGGAKLDIIRSFLWAWRDAVIEKGIGEKVGISPCRLAIRGNEYWLPLSEHEDAFFGGANYQEEEECPKCGKMRSRKGGWCNRCKTPTGRQDEEEAVLSREGPKQRPVEVRSFYKEDPVDFERKLDESWEEFAEMVKAILKSRRKGQR